MPSSLYRGLTPIWHTDPQPITSGGTGATTDVAALANLGAQPAATFEATHDVLSHLGVPGVGKVLRAFYSSDSTNRTGTLQVPGDNTAPQTGETNGTSISIAITPLSPSNLLYFFGTGYVAGLGASGFAGLFLFSNASTSALASSLTMCSFNQMHHCALQHQVTAGSGARTYILNYSAIGGSCYLNWNDGVTVLYANTLRTNLIILEVAP